MDFYTFAMKAPAYGAVAAASFLLGAGMVYGKGRLYGRKQEARKYRGLTLESWRALCLSNDPPTRCMGYDGVAALEDAELLYTLFEIEADEWNKFVVAYQLSKLQCYERAVTSYLAEFLFKRYGLCSVAEWEKMQAQGGASKPLYDRSNYVRPAIQTTEGSVEAAERTGLGWEGKGFEPMNATKTNIGTGSRNSRKGFTLVELLVVMGIIALLMGLLLPALATARARANGIKAQSNLRQIGTAMVAWSVDHDGKILPAQIRSTNGTAVYDWAAELIRKRYVEGPKIQDNPTTPTLAGSVTAAQAAELDFRSPFVSPAARSEFGSVNGYTVQSGDNFATQVTYAANAALIATAAAPANPRVLTALDQLSFPMTVQGTGSTGYKGFNTFANIREPMKTILISEAGGLLMNADPAGVGYNHRGGEATTLLFCDGHVEELDKDNAPNADSFDPATASDAARLAQPYRWIIKN